MFNRRTKKCARGHHRRLRFEALEDRRVLSAATVTMPLGTADDGTSAFVPREPMVLSVTDAEIPGLTYNLFHLLTPTQIPLLSPAQIATIPDIGAFGTLSDAARAALTMPQVQALQVATVRLVLLTPAQIAWLTTPQIQSIFYYDFKYLAPNQIPVLTPAQFASVSNDFTFRIDMSAAQRAEFTQPQVQAINVDGTNVRIYWLSSQQLSWLTASQIQQVIYHDFYILAASQIPSLSPNQIATVENDFTYRIQFTPAQRAALTQSQVTALKVDLVRIDWLTSQQRSWLTMSQVQKVIVPELYGLNENQTPWLTTAQIQNIDIFLFSQWTAAARHALTVNQVQALRVDLIQLDQLSSQQAGWLTPAQVQVVLLRDFWFLPPSQIPHLSLDQVRSITPGSFGLWSAASRAALTIDQVRVLNVRDVTLQLLTAEQINWLTTEQIQSLTIFDIPRLAPNQIPLVSPAQFAQMPNLFVISGFSDEVRANLTQAQLMALPLDVLSNYMNVEGEQYPPINYQPIVTMPIGPDGLIASDHSIANDVFRLARTEDATHLAIASGDWSNPAIWRDGLIPTAGATVAVPVGLTVRFDVVMTQAIKTLRIDGTFTFATNVDTTLRVDTIVVSTTGRLHIGTQTAPIADNVTARIIIPDGGPIDAVWDPYLLSRGLLSRGETRMYGRVVTPFATLAVDPLAGATTLQLTQPPVGWRVGDELVIAGTDPVLSSASSERVHIVAINGTVVTLDRPLTYSHDAPDGFGFSVQVANLDRNIQFLAEDSSVIQERPHIAFFDNPNVKIENVMVQGFGRTDKTKAINSPVVIGGVMQPGTGTNARARYAIHFHHTGVNPAVAPAVIRGNLVIDSPGWGYVNHQSNVVMENNVAIDVVGASFASEDGNEIGVMRGNLAMNSTGSGNHVLSRKANHDWGHGGHGYWLQGPGVELVDNIATGTHGAAFAYMTASSKTMFDTVNLVDPSIAMGRAAIPVGAVPLRPFRGNRAYASQQGLEMWFHMTNLNQGESVIEDFASWNTSGFGLQIPYVGRLTVRDSVFVGWQLAAISTGIKTNRLTHDLFLDNVSVIGFEVGMDVPVRRSTIVEGGRFSNVQNLLIAKGGDTIRTFNVTQPIDFIPLTPAQINGRPTFNVSVTQKIATTDNLDRKVDSLFSRDELRMALSDGSTVQLYFAEQGADDVPFTSAPTPAIAGFPTVYVGKPNLELSETYGVWFNGGDLPAGTFTPAGFIGLAVIESAAPSPDFNGDGNVGGWDFLAWQRGFGVPAPMAHKIDGDADDDRDVDNNDLHVWAGVFGQYGGAAAASAAAAQSAIVAPTGDVPATTPSDQSIYAAMAHEQMSAAPELRKNYRPRLRPR